MCRRLGATHEHKTRGSPSLARRMGEGAGASRRPRAVGGDNPKISFEREGQ